MGLHMAVVVTCVLLPAAVAGDAESYADAQFLDGSFDTLLAVKAADGSSLLRVTDDASLHEQVLGFQETSQIQETFVDGPLLDVLLTVNGLDSSLLALSRTDASLLDVSSYAEAGPEKCNFHTCRQTCMMHKCPGGYCDRLNRCRCFAQAVGDT